MDELQDRIKRLRGISLSEISNLIEQIEKQKDSSETQFKFLTEKLDQSQVEWTKHVSENSEYLKTHKSQLHLHSTQLTSNLEKIEKINQQFETNSNCIEVILKGQKKAENELSSSGAFSSSR